MSITCAYTLKVDSNKKGTIGYNMLVVFQDSYSPTFCYMHLCTRATLYKIH